MTQQRIICLDFEGILAPEIWPAIAKQTGIDELYLTTRDCPDFPDLMVKRMEILNEHNITLSDIIEVAKLKQPLEGAAQFLDRLRDENVKFVISSDMAEELATPLLEKLGSPLFFGHQFSLKSDGSFDFYDFRQDDPKRMLTEGYKHMNLEVFAVGDSYNDISMLQTADLGILFRSTDKVRGMYPDFAHTEDYNELADWLLKGL